MKRTALGLALALLAGFLFFGGGAKGDVSSAEARRLVAEGALLLDVRTSLEFAAGHLDGAVNVPVQELENRLPAEKDRAVVVYCRSGKRSATAKEILVREGFTRVHDLGAMSNW